MASLMRSIILAISCLFLSLPFAVFADEGIDDLKYDIANQQQLYLEVKVNQVAIGLYAFSFIDPDIYITNQTLTDLGIRFVCPKDPCKLASLPFSNIEYLVNTQELHLYLDSQEIDLPVNELNQSINQTQREAISDKGLTLNYDLVMNQNGDEHDITSGAFTNLRVFGSKLVFNSFQTSIVDNDSQLSHLRYDSYLDYYSADKLMSIRFGDSITQASNWARPMRMLGLHLSRDFSLNPNFSDRPNLDFAGSVTVPSTIDLYINGVKRFFGEAPTGNFSVDILPSFNGLGYASVIITDPLGQSTVQTKPIYYSNRLLKKNGIDWSLNAGKLRENYGSKSFDYYEDLVLTGKVRMGITDKLTVDTQLQRVEYQDTGALVNTGLGMTTIPHPFLGEVTSHYSISKYDKDVGAKWGIGNRWNNEFISFGSLFNEANHHYKDIPQLYNASLTLRSKYFYGGISTKKFGMFSLGYFERKNQKGDMVELLNGAWNTNLSDKFRLSVDLNQSLIGSDDWSVNLALTYTLNDASDISFKSKKNRTRNLYYVDTATKRKEVNGLSWNAGAVYDDNKPDWSNSYKYLEAEYANDYGTARGGVNSLSNTYFGLRGAVIYLDSSLYLSQSIYDSFATVDTNGIADIPVYLNNRLIGKTDSKGKKLVTGLYSYIDNEISIDTLNLPANTSADKVKQTVVPSRNAGVAVYYQIKTDASIILKIIDEKQNPIKMGARLYFPDEEVPALVGYDGMAYIENNSKPVEVTAMIPDEIGEYSDKNKCFFILSGYKASSNGGFNTETVTCKAEHN